MGHEYESFLATLHEPFRRSTWVNGAYIADGKKRVKNVDPPSLLRESPVTIKRLFVEGREAHASSLLAWKK